MTDNEIIKALECCSKPYCSDNKCPLHKKTINTKNCITQLSVNALDLINRQKAEIEMWKSSAELWESDAKALFTSRESLKAEAVKEFAERLRKSSSYSVVADGDREIPSTRWYSLSESNIDNLVKEMAGDIE